MSSKATDYFQLILQLLATNKSKEKNFSLYSVNSKYFETNASHRKKNSEHFKTISIDEENPFIAQSATARTLSSLCKVCLVNNFSYWEGDEASLTRISY